MVWLAACTRPPTKDELLDADGDGSQAGEDCDDGDAAVNQDAVEVCDGVDNDCDGATDEDDAEDAGTWYVDADGDGYGEPSDPTTACTRPEGTVDNAKDCDDTDAAVAPGAIELCDGVDNDCGGVTDENGAEDARTWYRDADGDGYGDARVTTTCTQPEGTVDNSEDCDDGDPTVYPGAAEACGDGVINDCDGEAATATADCGIGGTVSLESANLKLVGEASEDFAGASVSGAGDVDGDGRDDLLVGAYGEHTGGAYAGAAYLLLSDGALASGPSRLDLSEADVKLTGEASGDAAGVSVSEAGDVDGDGRDDLLVGAYGETTGGTGAGAAYLLLSEGALASGSSLLDLAEADVKLVGESWGDSAGRSVSGAGDVNGDGRDDLLIGAFLEDTSGTDAGAAYLLLSDGALASGSSLLDLAEADVKLVGEASTDYAGYSVSGAGDVDGDGRDDLLVGALYQDTGAEDTGAAYLLLSDGALASGSSLLDLSEADVSLVGNSSEDNAGVSVSDANDVDGDGRDDLLVGADRQDGGGTDAGAAYLLLSDGALASGVSPLDLSEADVTLLGEVWDDWAGRSVSGAGDVDGDGRGDLLVGAHRESAGGAYAGAAYLLLSDGALASGSARLDLSEADVKLTGEVWGDGAGSSVSGAGDVNGDGLSDLLVGAAGANAGGSDAGAAYLLYGGAFTDGY